MKMLFRAALLSLALTVPAAAQVAAPTQIETGFSMQGVGSVLTELGYQSQVQTLENGAQVIRAVSPNGLVFFARPTVCNSGRCVGLSLFAFWNREGGYRLDEINAFNGRYAFIKGELVGDADAFLSRYVIADFGIPRGNIASNINNFEGINRQLSRFVTDFRGRSTVSTTDGETAVASALPGTAIVAGEHGLSADDLEALLALEGARNVE